MNLRNVGSYNIGLDIGTASVGWAVTDSNGNLLHFNDKPTWGSRLFPEASKAADARVHRGQRRRYARRRWRLDLLQGIFAGEMDAVDPEFFIRLKQSKLFKEDREVGHSEYLWPLFNDADFDEKAYYEEFPTIYHLRKWLMQTDQKADLRLIYLAFHNIVKHRGNFLQQDNKGLSAEKADVKESVERFCLTLQDWCALHDIDCEALEKVDAISEVLRDTSVRKTELKERVTPLLSLRTNDNSDNKMVSSLSKAIASAVVGLSFKPDQIFFLFEEKPENVIASMYISNDEQVEVLKENIPDDSMALFESMEAVYSSYVLQEILSLAPGKPLSANKVEEYKRYKEQLAALKDLVREYAPGKYDEFFRGPLYEKLYPGEKAKYVKSESKGYTRYNEARNAPYDEFKKSIIDMFKDTKAVKDPRYNKMIDELDNERFLRRLKTSDNGSIPYQLHLEEMDKIIEKQSEFYPFLMQQKQKLDSLVEFRIPYYVGPLTTKNARRKGDNPDGEKRFAWSERKEGKESERIYPWNWEEIIDKDKSAEKFITRMTGTCTYLNGEPVLPKNSLLYQEFCVLNELNGARFTQDGDKHYRFDYADRSAMYDELFKNGSVSYKKVSDWMAQRGNSNVHVSGAQGEKGFESRLSSYLFFKKDVFDVDEIPASDYPMIEDIILWNTIFEDRDILAHKVKSNYGDRLTDDQIKKICRKRFTGWGNLSKKFLTQIKAKTDNGDMSLMDVLREGNPNNGHGSSAMVLMEALRDDKLRFQELVDKINAEKLENATKVSIEDLPGSPGIRRAINQAIAIVEEIVGIAGHDPDSVFVEVTRSDDGNKGQRTKRRYKALEEQLKSLKEENPEFWDKVVADELKRDSKANVDLTEKLTLYFMQGGKSLYSGKPLDIDRLSEYQVDHILPQAYIKDDSLENKALVLSGENQRKSDQLLLPADLRKSMRRYWTALHDAKLIGDKKYNNLLREEIKDKQLKGFINRQIVETSQIIKAVQTMLNVILPESEILPVKAGLSSELRHRLKLVKCREVNDFHHAHDALLACSIGRFIKTRFPEMYSNPLVYQKAIRKFVKQESERARQGHVPYDSSFIISSFLKSGFDEETGEITRDSWNATDEQDRIRKFFNYRQCYISRMPLEDSGAFWDETVYSPHDPSMGSKLKLALKKGLDVKKYGGYSREQFAFFFIFKALKKGKEVFEFKPIPTSIASALATNENAITDYAKQICEEDGSEFVSIIRKKIYKYQLIEIDSSRLYLTGQKEVRNGTQIALDQKGIEIAKRIVSDDERIVDEDELLLLFDRIKDSLNTYSRWLAKATKINEWDDAFRDASLKDKELVVMELFAIAAAKKNMIDLRPVGGSKYSGCMGITFSKAIANYGLAIIDQSVTGMFERRMHIGV